MTRLSFKPQRPKATVAVVGLPGHGKTVFLAGLFWDSFFALAHSLQDARSPYAVRALTEEASRVFYDNAILLRDLQLPSANPRIRPEPAILEFMGVPKARRATRQRVQLTFYDIAGEVFANDALAKEYAPFLTEAEFIIFLFDPLQPDFNILAASQLIDRVNRVVAGSARKQNLVVLSKMDQLRAQDAWAELINEYWPDAPPTQAKLSEYIEDMEELSGHLRNWWLSPDRRAANLVHALPANTRFCAVSALGSPPGYDSVGRLRLNAPPNPFRIRDPLFWIFRSLGVL